MAFTQIFITHSSKDSEIAQRMMSYLESRGIRCWIAPRDIPLGMQWAEAILDAIEESSAMLLVFSSNSNDSPQVLREVERAVSKRVPIYPVKIEGIEPCRAMEYYLSSHQWKEVFTGDLEEKLSQLVPTIRKHLGMDPDDGEEEPAGLRGTPGGISKAAATGSGKRTALKSFLRLALPVLAVAAAALIFFGDGEDRTSDTGGSTGEALPDTVPRADTMAAVEVRSAGDLTGGPVSGLTWSYIPAGSFLMGSPSEEPGRDPDEHPQVRVELAPFEMTTTEVTQEVWEEIMGGNPSFNASPGYPVENVSWDQCNEFLSMLDGMDPDHIYRLPTESEWEYACRAGSETPWFWGNDTTMSFMGRYCWYENDSGGETHPVGEKEASVWNLHDMSGNVLEWCSDYYHPDLTRVSSDGSPCLEPGAEATRVVRGGSARNSPSGCRSAARSSYAQDGSSPGIGFRIVRIPIEE
jgi:formylglycine-generating enzyme required for sulfatase activity